MSLADIRSTELEADMPRLYVDAVQEEQVLKIRPKKTKMINDVTPSHTDKLVYTARDDITRKKPEMCTNKTVKY